MASRYYFNLTNGEAWIRDEDGIDLPNLREALAYTLIILHELRQENPSCMVKWQGWRIEISDDSCERVTIVVLDDFDPATGLPQ